MSDQGFVDLRVSASDAVNSGSFWPSFTDIMTVVVMIFMLVSTVLILRQRELNETLQQTLQAEQMAKEEARSAAETNLTLEEKLAQAEHRISELRMQLMQMREANALQGQMLQERGRAISDMRQSLQGQAQAMRQLDAERLSLQRSLQGAQAQLSQTEQQLEESLASMMQLQRKSEEREQTLSQVQESLQERVQQLDLLQGDYDQLKVKYDKLVKPARSAKGKYVVEVRYQKADKGYKVRYSDDSLKSPKVGDINELEQHLDTLKKRYPKQLYIKIIIPEESGLSYSEAWGFMKRVLEKYDYYYQ